MNEVTLFNFEGNQVRTVVIDDEPYFVGKDVALAIGYKNFRDALNKHVKAKYKRESQIATPSGIQTMTVISEPGVYQLASQSQPPSAEPFQDWLYEDVLPAIRKTGTYLTDETAYAITHDKNALGDLLLRAGNQLKQKDLVIQELQPKADYTDKMLANPGLETISVIAKNFGYSTREFNKLLHGLGIQYKQGKTWLLYAKYQNLGYTHVEPYGYTNSEGIEKVRNTMKWTQKGQEFLYSFLKSKGILPRVEQTA
ncbi:phage repressor protein/antirepressor Ant [Levilactobacillus brevis]|uniref:phage antirepressor n=1 Tax=Levilactobacillus brevis TaxID=1580 RepID=UPI000A201E77|nr:phage antirepressor KilAC domain-containing protein [Levilactobacillus brevis]ARN92166.1 phage repressor protein/antirepressor Ant [Levilactobacillus brevis]ARN94860.1 phage repressor protein/antirepressor Ant [Levilactobacillus brevis]